MYSYNVIYDKYRYDLVAICTFAEYLRSGRCNSLQGHEGAYNIYENEIRMGIIISKLDEIITRLDRIEKNQYGIYCALKQISAQQNQILASLDTVCQQQRQQLETSEYMNYNLSVLKYHDDLAMIYGMYK